MSTDNGATLIKSYESVAIIITLFLDPSHICIFAHCFKYLHLFQGIDKDHHPE
jgi:hypothetical protein